jgi:hypothetical protein
MVNIHNENLKINFNLKVLLSKKGNSSEPTAAEAIADFVENQKQQEMTEIIRGEGVPSANLTSTFRFYFGTRLTFAKTVVDPKSAQPPAIRGQIIPPVTPPTPEQTPEPVAPVSRPEAAPIASITSLSPLTAVKNFSLIALSAVASLTLL